MTLRILVTAASVLLTAAATPDQSQRPCEIDRSQPQTFEQQLVGAACLMRQSGMSERGVSTVTAEMRLEQHEQQRIFSEIQANATALAKAAVADPFDVAAFETALRRVKEVQNAARSAAIDAEIRTFNSLSPADQRLYARLTFGPPVGDLRLGMPARPIDRSH